MKTTTTETRATGPMRSRTSTLCLRSSGCGSSRTSRSSGDWPNATTSIIELHRELNQPRVITGLGNAPESARIIYYLTGARTNVCALMMMMILLNKWRDGVEVANRVGIVYMV